MDVMVHDRGLRVQAQAGSDVRVAAVDALAVLPPDTARGVADALASMGSIEEVHRFVEALRYAADTSTH